MRSHQCCPRGTWQCDNSNRTSSFVFPVPPRAVLEHASHACLWTAMDLITVTQAVESKVVHVESKKSLHKLLTASISSLSCLMDGQPCHSFMSSYKKELTILVTCDTIISLGLLSFICKLLLYKFYSYRLRILCLFDPGSLYVALAVFEFTT